MSRNVGKYLKLSGVITFLIISIFFVITPLSSLTESTIEAGELAEGYYDFFRTITVPIGQSESGYTPGYRLREFELLAKNKSILKSTFSDTLIWTSRGPYNVSGRTRYILVDPDDPTLRTWYAGTAGGGIWKTGDAGNTWTDLTPGLPNLSTVSLAMSQGNHDIIYAGTGEGYGGVGMITGDGLFRTDDRGESWSRVESTRSPDFYYINDIWIAPDNPELLLIATNTGIFRTTDGGETWDKVYGSGNPVQDLQQNPQDAATLFAAVNSVGIIKSTDAGIHWFNSSDGIRDVRRLSIAVSPVDTNYIFAGAEIRNGETGVFLSTNAGDTWIRNGEDNAYFNFHGPQGWFNNTVVADPFIREKVYVGGVYIGALTFTDQVGESDPKVLFVDTLNTSSYLDFINFGGSYLGGGMSTGIEEEANVQISDFVSVEIRFGPGKVQKAHRFLVPEGRGPQVPPEEYSYADYVDVPFEVWDVTNNRQLMVSFRDQERDGNFNLIPYSNTQPLYGREYIFVHSLGYDPVKPDPRIAKDGGHYYKMLYFFWPTLADAGTWDPQQLPEGKISIQFGTYPVRFAATEIISSATRNTNLHVDHHQLLVIPGASADDDYTILSANDGGVALSRNSGESWEQMSRGFYTTQFYGAAKRSGKDEYIGGMQDNGTWISPGNQTATDKVNYSRVLGGDGFEVLWHPESSSKIIGSIYNNIFYVSNNRGVFWLETTGGLGDTGPFISKLSHSRSRPDTVYTIDADGVYVHPSFGLASIDWKLTPIEEGLSFYGYATSAIDVEVSKADPSIVWAGQGMYDDPLLNIFVSGDYAESFSAVSQYSEAELGFISAIETHPTEPAIAYLLFSYHGKPKILRTENFGASWEDISGFGKDSVSSNGFPDVVVLSLLVMPHDPDVIWAGTEIGIVESVDNGNSWHLLESEFPQVAVYQMDYQDNQVILATHGRGLWTAGEGVGGDTEPSAIGADQSSAGPFSLIIYPNPAETYVNIKLQGLQSGRLELRMLKLNGQVVHQESGSVSSTEHQLNLNLEELAPGNYFVEVINQGRIAIKRLVVVR